MKSPDDKKYRDKQTRNDGQGAYPNKEITTLLENYKSLIERF